MTKTLQRINSWFRRVGEVILKVRWLLIIALIIIDVLAFWGMTKVRTDKTWDSWFEENDPINIDTDKFEDVFGNNDYVGLLIEADDVFQPDVLQMIRDLGNDMLTKVPLSTDVTSLAEFEYSLGTEEGMNIDNLVPDPVPDDPAEIEKIRKMAFAKENLVNRLFTEDSKQTWLIMRLREYPDDFEKTHGEEGAVVIGRAVEKIIHNEKYEKYNIKHTGMPMVGYRKMEFFTKEAGRIIGLALIAVLVVLIVTLRTLPGVIIPLVTTFSSIIVTYGFMGFMDISIDNSLMTIPVYLGLAVSVGYSIHIFNFFKRRFIETGNRKDAVLYAIENTGWPLFFTALTTIGSLLSFNLAKIVSIQWVGNASASIIGVVFIFVIILTPALLSFGKDKQPKKYVAGSNLLRTDKFFNGLAENVLKNSKAYLIVFIVIASVLAVGLTKTKVDFDTFKSFGLKIPYVKELSDVSESLIGALYSYDVVVEFGEEGMAKLPENLKRLETLEMKLKELELTKRTTSILDIIKDMNRTLHSNDESYYILPDDDELTANLLLMYEMSGGNEAEKWLDYEYKRLRLMIEISRFEANEVEKEITYVRKLSAEIFPESEVMLVGTLIQGALINNYIARGQISTFIFALVVIGILMMIVFRSIKTGLIGLVPNLTPVLVIGGLMGHLGLGMDMMTMTIIPMIMGIAVDDTIHYINHCKLEVERGEDYRPAIFNTFKTVGKALFMTTFILVITFIMYTTSIAQVYVNLGLFIAAGLISALIADYTMTPILLNMTKPFKKEK
ncbi:MAG: MMPL family transporter [Ignavibacteria bacterium]|jgi:predicted RND superfamily exporter protein